MGLLFLAIACAAVLGGGGYLIFLFQEEAKAREEERRLARAGFRELLTRELRRTKASGLDFAALVGNSGIERGEADEVAQELYGRYSRKVFSDGAVSDDERRILDRLANTLAISSTTASLIERKAKEERYQKAVSDAMADGSVTTDELGELEGLRRSLGIGRGEGLALAEDDTQAVYVAEMRRIVRAGRFSPEIEAGLARLKRGLDVSDHDAVRFLANHAENLFRECVTMALQDGVVTAEELQMMNWLQREAGLPEAAIAQYRREIRDVERRNAYRQGDLPSIRTSKLLEGGETCHWDGACSYRYETAKSSFTVHGELLVTSKKIAFLSPSKSITFQPSRILDLILYSNCIELKCSSKNGTGRYVIDDPRTLEAILTGVVRKHKFLLSENYSSVRTRHIPDDVKREVWDRDGGRCVRCGAADYLEFDHIIPHSRGGANTVGNVQLLCRGCNNLKGDRI